MTTWICALTTLLGGPGFPDDEDLPLTLSLNAPRPPRRGPLPGSMAESDGETAEEEPVEGEAADPETVQDEPDPQDPRKPPRPTLEPPARPAWVHDPPHGSFLGFFRTHLSSQAWDDNVYRDYLTTSSVLLPLSFAAAAGLVSPWDASLQSGIEGSLGNRPEIGNMAMYSVIAGSVVLGVLFPGEGRTSWDVLWEEAEAYAVTGILTTALKLTLGRRRPHGDSTRSFPSGHAANAFTAAALIQENSGWGFGGPAYGLAGLTGYSRIEAGRHFPSDVLAGAAIGILTVGILDALHWGNHGAGRGIARADRGPRIDFAFDPGREKQVELGITLKF